MIRLTTNNGIGTTKITDNNLSNADRPGLCGQAQRTLIIIIKAKSYNNETRTNEIEKKKRIMRLEPILYYVYNISERECACARASQFQNVSRVFSVIHLRKNIFPPTGSPGNNLDIRVRYILSRNPPLHPRNRINIYK